MVECYNYISVIVPCYNCENSVERCILSLLQQDYPKESFEIILIDNGSTDSTPGIIHKNPVKLMTEGIKNPYMARNKGALNAKGNILAFTDSDCIADKNWLKSINDCINNGADATQGPGYLTKQTSLIARAESYRLISTKNHFWGDTKNFTIKKNIFLDMNGFFPYFTGSDGLLFEKLRLLNYKIEYNEKQILYKEFPEKYSMLIKKSWKYGKGDLINDCYLRNLDRKERLKRIFQIPFKIVFQLTGYNTLKQFFIENFYINTHALVRDCSYVINYRKVIKDYHEITK